MKINLTATFLTITLLLSGCSSPADIDGPNPALLPDVSESDFRSSLEVLRLEHDDFDNSDVYSWKASKKIVSIKKDSYGFLALTVTKDENGVSRLTLSANYVGDDWIFFDNVQIKTTKETYEWYFSQGDTVRDTNDDATVSEFAVVDIQDARVAEFLDIANDPTSKFRLNGSEGEEFSANLTKTARTYIKDSVHVYVGLTRNL